MKISINIPSYRRPHVKTLEYLPDASVWVAESDYEQYKEANKNANIIAVPEHIQGNLCRIRNYILDKCFENGDDAVCLLDDDFQGLYEWRDDNRDAHCKMHKLDGDYIPYFLEKYSYLCEELGYKLWGVNCAGSQRMAQGNNPFSSQSYIGGPFSVHLKNRIRYDERLPLKEDFDMTLKHIQQYRGCLRVNHIVYINDMSNNVGGCATYRNLQKEKEQFLLLQKKWGNKIIRVDKNSKKSFDYNPILKSPIKGM